MMIMPGKKANHLAHEQSPYLLQHAFNPVDWHPWSKPVLEMAARENRLLVISIGYSACHWCHVMEHESFEDDEVALIMNNAFVCIKVDREERPDIDQLYMTACQVMTGRGGWPLNIIALPDQRPVFAGTYLSKRDWTYVLNYFADIHRLQPAELERLAKEVTGGLQQSLRLPNSANTKTTLSLEPIVEKWRQEFDPINGGGRGAPKFPMPASLGALLAYGHKHGDKAIMTHVGLTLEKIAMGGIFDHVGGGFARYSVDGLWNIPHFEKMLYDNAQLISLCAQFYTLTGEPFIRSVLVQSLDYINREMKQADGLFYSGLDADSEGVEGKFYAWSQESLDTLTGEDSDLFSRLYSCSREGNWEDGLNVLRLSSHPAAFAAANGLSAEALNEKRIGWMALLLLERDKRIRPETDDKVLTCWNGMMISALVEAGLALEEDSYLMDALRAGCFYADSLEKNNGFLWRNFKGGGFHGTGFLDDYAFLIKGFVDIYMAGLDPVWLSQARSLTEKVRTHFNTASGIFFRLSPGSHENLIGEVAELTDHVIASSNAQMAWNLYILGHLLHEQHYIEHSERMVSAMTPQLTRNPAFHSHWFALLELMQTGPVEVGLTGQDARSMLKTLRRQYLPGCLFSANPGAAALNIPKPDTSPGKNQIYICRGKTCLTPVESADEALSLIRMK